MAPGIRTLVLSALCMGGAFMAAHAGENDLVSLELRLRPDAKPANPALPASVPLKAPRNVVINLPAADPDGIYRRAGFLLTFRDDPPVNAMVRLDVRGPDDRD